MGSESEYEFEYSDVSSEDENQDYEVENEYYNSKALVDSGKFSEALTGFLKVVDLDKSNGEWGFKALKQCVKMHWRLKQYEEMMKRYKQLLKYVTENKVTRNLSENVINAILDFVSSSSSCNANTNTNTSSDDINQNQDLLIEFYQTTLNLLRKQKAADRLCFKINLKLGYLFFETGKYAELVKVLKGLYKMLDNEDDATGEKENIPTKRKRLNDSTSFMVGTEIDQHRRGTQLLEVYALQIQLYTLQKDNKKLQTIYHKAMLIKTAAVSHPRVHAVIRECGGKMHMQEHLWEKARTDFFEAFKNYDEAGDPRRINCLKYLVLANMLTRSKINPFEGQEAKPYENHPEIKVMTELVDAFLHDEVKKFEKILEMNRKTIMEDIFISKYITELLRTVRSQVLEKMIKPYTRIALPFISKELMIPVEEVEDLLVSLILDGKIKGHIDQIRQILILESRRGDGSRKFLALQKLTEELGRLSTKLRR
uniref:PCI domain-containing protein n=1 Tax=Aplanochytrium stocchinoi TaxID=215587 RepID=A0A7S3V278_9STRA|mmetsp:Transcript_36256/g.45285  ORF Transcript_36256/g.45285 Transcript_36256/m.45285 type:complete len:482 (-) Transcript_36256:1157-2602(-)